MFLGAKKEDKFYSLFQQSTELTCQAAQKLEKIMQQDRVSESDAEEMNILENQADAVNTQIVDRLNTTFITPLDREDIYSLAQVLDDVVDYTEGTIERMQLYRTGKPSAGTLEMARSIVMATEQLRVGFSCLNNIKVKKSEILAATEKVYQIENGGDKLYQKEVARLFEEEKDPIEIIKWKEILELLETVLDHCEIVADQLKGMVLKYD
ncbi:MAG: DUF47 family protein [Peptococcaceae bacterium]|jgi:predicted phosphate transport protein (TIGR00153 family)|nr:DUF47 family protein [Peptococcaceae bacterium]